MGKRALTAHAGLVQQGACLMALVQHEVLDTLDQSLSAAVASISASTLQLERGHGGGTALAWDAELAVTSSFHCPDQTQVLVPDANGALAAREATVIGRDAGLDLALLRVDGGGLVSPSLRDPASLAVGNLAIAVGRPGRSARASMRMIGVLGKEVRTPRGGLLETYIETDRMIPRGFAGGPLVDSLGRVIGMNTRTLWRGHDLAVPAAALTRSVAQLVAHGGILRGYLGVGVTAVVLAKQLAEAVGKQHGALISSLDDGGPAEQGGLRQGDIIVAIAGEEVTGPAGLRQAIGQRPGATVDVEAVRGGSPIRFSVALGTRS
jgi:serine protease DegQ